MTIEKTTSEDARFAAVGTDPRFRRPKKKSTRVRIDPRFGAMFTGDGEFGGSSSTALVDKYGRRDVKGGRREGKELKKYYELEGESSSGEDEQNQEEDEQVSDKFSSESESSQDEEQEALMDEVMRAHPLVNTDVAFGDASRRLAMVNMDWDQIKAVDIYTVCAAFKPPTGSVLSVKIYPSQFGRERLERERVEGPPKDIYMGRDDYPEEERQDQDQQDFDQMRLRKYQLERLKYYFAVIECDSVQTAEAIYASCDGREFEQSSNIIDLRYIPEGEVFEEGEVGDVASPSTLAANRNAKSAAYRPRTDMTTPALQNSAVRLTWDQDDPDRTRITRANLYTGRKERARIDEYDLDMAAYLASASSDDEEEREGDVKAYRERLLGGKGDDVFGRESGDAKHQLHQLDISFTSAINTKINDDDEVSDVDKVATFSDINEEDCSDEVSEEELTVFEREQRKIKDKMAAKRTARRAAADARRSETTDTLAASAAELALFISDKGKEDKIMGTRKLDPTDTRFAAIYDKPEYAIDPSAPGFKRTEGMELLLQERAKRRKLREGDQ